MGETKNSQKQNKDQADQRLAYDFSEVEPRWQQFWEEEEVFKAPDVPKRDEKYYLLVMFAYPSGDIHMGHFRNYIYGDAIVRQKWMQGRQVLHPFGWDAFGLPAEQAAIKRNLHPNDWTMSNIEVSRNTLKKVGISFDWNREVITCLPEYYRWSQWIFLRMHEKGLAYRKDSLVNFCPTCNTVLANEQVEPEGTCWRCHDQVIKKRLNQWFFKITEYADRLLQSLDDLEGWPDRLKAMQRNWIGKSVGCEVKFKLADSEKEIPVFTTRPDTIYGVTFMAIAPEAELLDKLEIPSDRKDQVEEYIKKSIGKSEIERQAETEEKDGVFTGLYAINPFNGEKVQLWVADYVLASYGTGVVMAVPAHDQRDFLFARKYDIPIKIVIKPEGGEAPILEEMKEAYVEKGEMINSDLFDGSVGQKAIEKVTNYAEEKGIGRRQVNFRLRDWLLSRQRYWGTPIPIVHCLKCGEVPVPDDQLPVELPMEGVDYIPRGRSPLADVDDWVNVECPKCGNPAKRDADTMDTFICSSWYMLRYVDNKNSEAAYDVEKANAWFPIDMYIGGITHATGHLIYFRFFTKFLHDIGMLDYDEPAQRVFNHGMVMDAQGVTMSKSLGNVVSPIELIEERGVDVTRLAMFFAAPADREMPWTSEGLVGVERFLNKFYRLIELMANAGGGGAGDLTKQYDSAELSGEQKSVYIRLNQTIKKLTYDIEQLQFNTAVAAIMEFLGGFDPGKIGDDEFNRIVTARVVQLIAPMAPHFAEEAWRMLGYEGSIFKSAWPSYDEGAVKFDTITVAVQINGKVRDQLEVERDITEDDIKELALGREKVQKHVEGKELVKTIYVKEKLLSLVVR